MRRVRAWMAAMVVLAAGAGAEAVHAQAVSEPAVKAAFLYKFLGYVEWPAQAVPVEPTYVIAIAGAEEVAAELDHLVSGRSINGRRITVRRVRDVEGVRGAQVLFVGRNQPNAREMLRAVQRQGVLTVTETEHGLDGGSIVNLVTLEDRVGFEVSLEAADRAGIGISSRMLGVARRVVPKGVA
jgi:hypothetical protein